MNERIKLLAEQAGCDWWEGRAQRDMTRCDTELQKFAELIVRECASKAWFAEQYGIGDGAPVSKQIREHFGVEE